MFSKILTILLLLFGMYFLVIGSVGLHMSDSGTIEHLESLVKFFGGLTILIYEME